MRDVQVAPELRATAPFSHIQFSADGKLMLCVAEGHIYQLDAFNGSLLQTYNTGAPVGLGAIFSPDSNYILSGQLLLIALPGGKVSTSCVQLPDAACLYYIVLSCCYGISHSFASKLQPVRAQRFAQLFRRIYLM